MVARGARKARTAKRPPAARAPEAPAPVTAPVAGFPVVGIGASAGGLAAFEAFFSGMPAGVEPGMAFVLVQHLAPDYKSMLAELIQRYTRMRVFEVEDGMRVEPNCAYIIPPNRDMAYLSGSLHLLEPAARRGQRLPIDFFFRSLALSQHEQAVCIVLSGTGSDGTLGMRAIKGEGGMAMAQDPASTEYDGMPRSAIATGLVDYVLPPAEMPARLIAYARHAFGTLRRPGPPGAALPEDALNRLLVLLRVQTGHDFSLYKKNSVTRRVERRMAVQQLTQLDDYVRYLRESPAEGEALFRDLLIGVTSFFRDPETFAALAEQVLPKLFAGKPTGATIRVWVVGCSTGEEAYSLAILLQEHLETLKQSFRVLVFATDLDRRAIETARAGVYPASIAADIAPARLARFFVPYPAQGTYRIHKSIRDLLVFSEQDVIQDPPFSKLDLISCRNLLIYLGAELQKKLIPLFHYALNPGGVLFLGNSETVGTFLELFSARDRKSRLYTRREPVAGTSHPILGRGLSRPSREEACRRPRGNPLLEGTPGLRELAEQALLQQYGAVAALVDDRGEILYLHGHTGRYLEPAPGEAGLSIVKMAREGLRHPLTSLLRKAEVHGECVRHEGLRIKTNGDFTTVHLTVRPVARGPGTAAGPGLCLVIFEDEPAAEQERIEKVVVEEPGKETRQSEAESQAQIASLKQELQSKEEYLQTTLEEMETSNEELKSSNEELQSVNEELQSTNEELETAKEELQSVNEELATVNAELQTRVAELSRANNDMSNLLAGTGIGTIFVDHQLRLQRFTPSVTDVINLIPGDLGRPVGHIASNLVGYDCLSEDVTAVLETLVPREVEVQSRAGAWYLLRIRPYRTLENVIEGAVITFTDITETKAAARAVRESEVLRRLAMVVRDASDAITVQDLNGRILVWNPGAERMYGWSETEALAMNLLDLIPERQRSEALAAVRRLAQSKVLEPVRMQRLCKDGRCVDITLTATALMTAAGEAYAIATKERGDHD